MKSLLKINNEDLIRSGLLLEWPKISEKELDRIVSRHGELKEILKVKYNLSKEESFKSAISFFKTYRNRIEH